MRVNINYVAVSLFDRSNELLVVRQCEQTMGFKLSTSPAAHRSTTNSKSTSLSSTASTSTKQQQSQQSVARKRSTVVSESAFGRDMLQLLARAPTDEDNADVRFTHCDAMTLEYRFFFFFLDCTVCSIV
jgi:hypothetical protein